MAFFLAKLNKQRIAIIVVGILLSFFGMLFGMGIDVAPTTISSLIVGFIIYLLFDLIDKWKYHVGKSATEERKLSASEDSAPLALIEETSDDLPDTVAPTVKSTTGVSGSKYAKTKKTAETKKKTATKKAPSKKQAAKRSSSKKTDSSCPQCDSDQMIKWGKARGKSRLRCKDCGKTTLVDQ